MKTALRSLVCWMGLGMIGLPGCSPPSPSTSSGPATEPATEPVVQEKFDTESGPFAAGKKVFVANGCFRCHTIDGVRGPAGGAGAWKANRRAPDLGKAGKDASHTVEWLTNYIRDPKAVNPDARMPSFQNKIKDDDLRALAEYLASLK